jgi:hypothetical protein
MKNILLLLSVMAFYTANAQITVNMTGFGTIVLNDRVPPTATYPAQYSTPTTGSGPYYFLNRSGNTGLNNYWSLWYMNSLTSIPSKIAESSYDTALEPPCFDTWKSAIGFYPTTITGVSCRTFPHGGTPSVTPSGIIYPIYTSNQLYAMTSPMVGLTVFDISLGKLRTWSGSQWLPL